MLHLRSFTRFSMHLECWNAFRDLVNRISSETNVIVGISKIEYSEGPPGDVLRTSWGRPESNYQGRPLNVGLGRLLNVISGRPYDVRLGRSWDVRSERLRDGQIGPLVDVLGTLEGDVLGTSWGPTFAGWVVTELIIRGRNLNIPPVFIT